MAETVKDTKKKDFDGFMLFCFYAVARQHGIGRQSYAPESQGKTGHAKDSFCSYVLWAMANCDLDIQGKMVKAEKRSFPFQLLPFIQVVGPGSGRLHTLWLSWLWQLI